MHCILQYYVLLQLLLEMRNYKRKTTRQKWNVDQMQKAIEAVNRGEMGLGRTALKYSVPKSTLEDRLRKLKEISGLQWMKIASSAFTESPEVFFLVPQARRSVEKNSRKRGKTVILTESPYKNELEKALEKQRTKNSRTVKRNLTGKTGKIEEMKKLKPINNSNSEDESEENE